MIFSFTAIAHVWMRPLELAGGPFCTVNKNIQAICDVAGEGRCDWNLIKLYQVQSKLLQISQVYWIRVRAKMHSVALKHVAEMLLFIKSGQKIYLTQI